jgi:hypothetical protein
MLSTFLNKISLYFTIFFLSSISTLVCIPQRCDFIR